ncbi:hypothetical protein LAZ67_3005817 [Cordylochernes scorpioides]|uniref:Uncharacterized protein n=1 Tax=Cordylochernes scorpioides TaxID=51811 RepID=A0ABY6KBG6_9ARAC|nr:hypothetical protein LAZ67_3005817 [Cordylochernes scorpioides]
MSNSQKIIRLRKALKHWDLVHHGACSECAHHHVSFGRAIWTAALYNRKPNEESQRLPTNFIKEARDDDKLQNQCQSFNVERNIAWTTEVSRQHRVNGYVCQKLPSDRKEDWFSWAMATNKPETLIEFSDWLNMKAKIAMRWIEATPLKADIEEKKLHPKRGPGAINFATVDGQETKYKPLVPYAMSPILWITAESLRGWTKTISGNITRSYTRTRVLAQLQNLQVPGIRARQVNRRTKEEYQFNEDVALLYILREDQREAWPHLARMRARDIKNVVPERIMEGTRTVRDAGPHLWCDVIASLDNLREEQECPGEQARSISVDLRADGAKLLKEKSSFVGERVLGMWWNPEADAFGFGLRFHKVPEVILSGVVPTKRQACSLVMIVYDPLGLVNHFKIKDIMLLQRTWISEIDWDQEFPKDIYNDWLTWLGKLKEIARVRVPRRYDFGFEYAKEKELQVFIDASHESYASIAYLRYVHEMNKISFALFGSKARVAPVRLGERKKTIPQLELQAAVLGSRFAVTIKCELNSWLDHIVFWSDSKVVLSWISANDVRHKDFKANRVVLARGKAVKQEKLAQLSPVLIDGIICLKSRVQQAKKLLQSQKTPGILPSRHHFTGLLIQEEHE